MTGALEAVTLDGQRFDCGSVAGYLEAFGSEVGARALSVFSDGIK